MTYLAHDFKGAGHHHPMAVVEQMLDGLGGWVQTVLQAGAASRAFEQLNGLSDEKLNEMGLERAGLAQHLAGRYLQKTA